MHLYERLHFQPFEFFSLAIVHCGNQLTCNGLSGGRHAVRVHVLDLRKLLANVGRDRRRWGNLLRGLGGASAPRPAQGPVGARSHLEEVQSFGTNPGNLRMFRYLPPRLAADAPLVVVLHGCTQTAAGYDLGAGWSTLAKRYGFALLLPEQQRSNNPNGCFNWFQLEDIERGRGECLSIRQMVEAMVRDNRIDRRRVFVTGLSAGGAMTSVMLACYPEVFAAGAIIAGLPYRAASNVQQAFESMYQCPTRSAHAWGHLVRGAAPRDGRWPRVSVWHGSADKTVIPGNAQEILKQWIDVHGVTPMPNIREVVDGYPREAWIDDSGEAVIESFTVTDMAHGTPLATGAADGNCGAAGPFLLEVGISSSYHIAKFFGLAQPLAQSTEILATATAHRLPIERPTPAPSLALSDDLDQKASGSAAGPTEAPRVDTRVDTGVDIGAIITKALTAAGLMKGR
jgi:poly(hydroxyalkanoate) depolymerase family esterase